MKTVLNRRPHILTIVLEDYFHGRAFRGLIDPKSWGRFETRYEKSALAALELLQRSGSRATFFVNDWVARQRSEVLAEILRQGHEIALSGDVDRDFHPLPMPEFREKLRRARSTVEQACGRQILGYRGQDVLFDPNDLRALEVLAEEGFLYDSSLNPTSASTFRKAPWRRFVHEQHFGARSIQEFPLSSHDLGGVMVPFAGGNYFRQYPERFVRWLIRRWEETEPHPLVLYFRLWDLDPAQPRIQTGSLLRNLRHYRNGERMIRMIGELFERYQFESIAGSLGVEQRILAPEQNQEFKAMSAPRVLTANGALTVNTGSAAAFRREVSIIIPCYNEEASIPYLSRALDELKSELTSAYDAQFIFVDDGSTDQTWQKLNEIFGTRRDALLLRHKSNRGVAAAIGTGLEHAREIACSMDCDCSYDPRELKPMLDLFRTGVDLVTASPYHPEGHVSNVPAWRVGLSRSASLLYQTVTGRKLYTFTSCLRVYRRSAALGTPLKHTGFLGIAELAGKFALTGRKIVEHPATLELRLFGRSKMKIARTIGGHLGLLAALARLRIARGPDPSSTGEGPDRPPCGGDSATTSEPVAVPAGIHSHTSGLKP